MDRGAARGDVATAVAAAVRGGVDWVQIRERSLDGAVLLSFAERLADAARGAARESGREVRVLVNRRADVALAIGADGVHLGFDGMDVASARRVLGPGAWIGVSAHSPAEVRAAVGASYVHLAPVFPPLSKAAERPALGLEALAAAAGAAIPVIAQGGVDADNAGAVRAAGAAGVAVTGAILLSDDPGAAARALRQRLDAARPTRRLSGRDR